jgi:hypothetical protein
MNSDAEPPKAFRTPSDMSGARARWIGRVAVLARRKGVSFASARAMAIALSTERGITVDEAIEALSSSMHGRQMP